MTLIAIAAVAQNGVIGNNNQLIWHLPNDLKHFKNLTKGHTMIMGRKTWESLGSKPLPHRRHIVITRNIAFEAEEAEVVSTIDEALELAKGDEKVFIVGGGEIYKLAMPYIQRLELTIVHNDFEGDTFFPDIEANDWEEISSQRNEADERNPYAYSFITLQRKNRS